MRQTRMRRSAQGTLLGRLGATGAVVLAGSGGVGMMWARQPWFGSGLALDARDLAGRDFGSPRTTTGSSRGRSGSYGRARSRCRAGRHSAFAPAPRSGWAGRHPTRARPRAPRRSRAGRGSRRPRRCPDSSFCRRRWSTSSRGRASPGGPGRSPGRRSRSPGECRPAPGSAPDDRQTSSRGTSACAPAASNPHRSAAPTP